MGLIGDSFKWLVGLKDASLDNLNIEQLDEKIRGTKRLQAQWEREIKESRKQYDDLLSPDKNLGRSKTELRFAVMKSRIAARQVRDLTNAVNMLYRMGGLIESLKMLKKLHDDLRKSGAIPGGLTLAQFVKAVDKIHGGFKVSAESLRQMEDSLTDLNREIEGAIPESTGASDDEVARLMEEYQTLVAEGKGNSPEALEKKAQIDEKLGVRA